MSHSCALLRERTFHTLAVPLIGIVASATSTTTTFPGEDDESNCRVKQRYIPRTVHFILIVTFLVECRIFVSLRSISSCDVRQRQSRSLQRLDKVGGRKSSRTR